MALRIVLIDDNESVRRPLRQLLKRAGRAVTEADNGRTALEQLKDASVDLVISDVFMPDMNGYDFLMRVRDAYPGTRVIMMSGGGDLGAESVLSAAEKLGADHVMQKPFGSDELLAAVDRVTESDQ